MNRIRTGVVLVLITVAVASCSSSPDEVAEPDTPSSESTGLGSDQTPNPTVITTAPTVITTSTTEAPADTTAGVAEYCALFNDIRAATAASGGDPNSEAAWQERLGWTEEMAPLAPTGYEQQAQVYLTLVRAREQLLAQYGYVSVQELPADVRTSFISDHVEEQQISNQLIEYSTSTC